MKNNLYENYNIFSMSEVNFYKMENTLLEVKKEFREACRVGNFEQKESNLEIWEEKIFEMEDHYKTMCNLYQQEINILVLSW
jgi:hypothetical protein